MANDGEHRSSKEDSDDELMNHLNSVSFYSPDLVKSVNEDESSKSPDDTPLNRNSEQTIPNDPPSPVESSKSPYIPPLCSNNPHRSLSYSPNPNFASTSSSTPRSLLLRSLQGSYGSSKPPGFGSFCDDPPSTSFPLLEQGESSKSPPAPPLYYDKPPMPPLMQYRTTYDHSFASTGFNSCLFKSLQGSYGNSKPPGFGCTLRIKDTNTLPDTPPFNPIPFPRSGISELDCPFTLELIQTPSSLYRYACNEPERIESLINSLANSQLLLGKLVDSLSESLVKLACNSKGRRVILYCFTNLKPSCILALSDKMARNCLILATDRLGCILLNDCIPLMVRSYQESILFTICTHAQILAPDCYGTYVVQNVVSAEYAFFTPWIVMEITPLFRDLSTQKEGSHLVEKCIESNLTRAIAVKALVELKPEELQQIACNEFGNFVIQKALTSTNVSILHSMLRAALLPLVQDLKRNKFGRNVASKLQNGSKR